MIIFQRKCKEMRVIAKGRGRKLKRSEFADLATIISFAFGELDVTEGGGGLEAHPRLTIGTMYRSSDNATTMKQAHPRLTLG